MITQSVQNEINKYDVMKNSNMNKYNQNTLYRLAIKFWNNKIKNKNVILLIIVIIIIVHWEMFLVFILQLFPTTIYLIILIQTEPIAITLFKFLTVFQNKLECSAVKTKINDILAY